jgi:hypothetical protein
MAANFRSKWGSVRGAPECITQRFPAATPQVGQGTEDNCSGESSFLFIRRGDGITYRKPLQYGTPSSELANDLG